MSYGFNGCRAGLFADGEAFARAGINGRIYDFCGGGAFHGCCALQSVTMDEGNTAYKVEDEVLCSADGSHMILYLPTESATGLTSFTVPDSVRTIVGNAFSRDDSLTTVLLPEELETIEGAAFFKCSALKNVGMPSCTVLGDNAFEPCTALRRIVLPEGIPLIDWAAFAMCDKLETVVLPQSVTSISDQAFADDPAPLFLVLRALSCYTVRIRQA